VTKNHQLAATQVNNKKLTSQNNNSKVTKNVRRKMEIYRHQIMASQQKFWMKTKVRNLGDFAFKKIILFLSFAVSGNEEFEDSQADTSHYEVMESEIYNNEVTQTISPASFSTTDQFNVDQKSSEDSIISSSSSDSDEDSSKSSDDRFQNTNNDQSQVTSRFDYDNDSVSTKRLLSDESSNQREDEVIDDQPVTADLTLTKTVELTENEPDPEEIKEPLPEPSEQKTFNQIEPEVDQPLVMEMVKQVEEPNDVKDMSLNNFESTMDDISDNELESLEQELDCLVAMAEQNVENTNCEIAVKALEESVEKTLEIKDEPAVMATQEIVAENLQQIEETTPCVAVAEDISVVQEPSPNSENEPESISEAQEAVEPSNLPPVDPALSTSSTDESTSIQNLPSQSHEDYSINESNSTGSLTSAPDLGRIPPYWIPDNMTNSCMQCDLKFSMLKRRHHCRACGLLLCSGCCSEKFHLHYLGTEGRICLNCHEQLVRLQQQQQNHPRNPSPGNPMEYCSTLPPQQQVAPGSTQPPTVMVPSGVLKRGPRSSERKSVIFSDGIRPGTDLNETPPSVRVAAEKPPNLNMPTINEKNSSFIPESGNELPPVLLKESEFRFVDNNLALLQRLRQEELKFAISKNFYVTVKIVTCEIILLRSSRSRIIYIIILTFSDLLHQQNCHQLLDVRSFGSATRRTYDFARVER
jgi:hypothetical protein